jgi:hypothetical protein
VLPGTTYLSNYGLGSPFPEDSMLCAALSSFWPAAAPDITRVFAPGKYAITTPLTDDVIGQTGEEPWDGIPPPQLRDGAAKIVEYYSIEYGNYVQAALQNKFNFGLIGQMTAKEYGARTLAMARVYTALGAVKTEEKAQWALFSFINASPEDPDRIEAERQTGVQLSPDYSYRFKMFKPVGMQINPDNFKTKLITFDEMLTIFADTQTVLKQGQDGNWTALRY